MERLTESGPPKRWENRKLDELEVPTYPIGGDILRKCLVREIGPVLATLADVPPAETHDCCVVDGKGETETLPPGVAFEQLRAPHPIVVEIAEHRVVARPDLVRESHGITTGNQLDPSHWRRRSDIATHVDRQSTTSST